jgi:hypothetical protein
MRKPSDLNPTQRKSYDLWRDLGLTESAAMNALVEDGVITLSEDEQLARTLRHTFGLSEQAAEIAARGGGGPSSRPVSEASSSWLKPGDNQRLIALVEQWASDIRFRGGPALIHDGESRARASVREAYFKVCDAAQNDVQKLWIHTVVESQWPRLLAPLLPRSGGNKGSSGSSGGSRSTQTRKVGETTRQPGRRTVSGG